MAGWECIGYGESAGDCSAVVHENRLYCDPCDISQGAVLPLCDRCARAARVDGVTLVPAHEYEVAR